MIKPLTSFRFIAALLVFLYHAGIWQTYQTGSIGVTFFFILSGFILSINYKERLYEINVEEIKKFYLARFAKIYPTHLLTFFIAIPIYFFIELKHSFLLYILQAITNVFLLQSYIPFGYMSFNGPSWSISVEFFFYVLFPFILVKVLKHLKGTRKKLGTLFCFWISMVMIAMLFSLWETSPVSTRWLFYIFPLTRILDFFVGVVLGILFLEVKDFYRKSPTMVFSFLEGLSILLVVSIILYSPNVTQNLRYGLFYIPFLSLIIFVFAFQRGIFSIFLSNKFFVYLGEISFSFYMLHNLVFTYTYWSLLKLNINAITIAGCFMVTLLFSSLLYYFYEEPWRKKIRYRFNETGSRFSKKSADFTLS